MEHSFQVGDQDWLYISKDTIQGEGKKLKSIRYGPIKILEKIDEIAFSLIYQLTCTFIQLLMQIA